ncbi:putative toxin-antitoxin system toxin component, PIN family [Pseudomonas sp. R2.Fl]|nr:putative toxin-antitoxin system toxin component, PIN family [Pseudomonas sp. R2.Fl]
MIRIVVDTNVLVSACIGRGPASKVIEACMTQRIEPLVSPALYLEYEDVVNRDAIFRNGRLNRDERNDLLDAFLGKCIIADIYYRWRPNLRDEADNHIIDLAVAGNARYIVTSNIRDFAGAELKFDQGKIIRPEHLLEELRL